MTSFGFQPSQPVASEEISTRWPSWADSVAVSVSRYVVDARKYDEPDGEQRKREQREPRDNDDADDASEAAKWGVQRAEGAEGGADQRHNGVTRSIVADAHRPRRSRRRARRRSLPCDGKPR